MSKSDVSTFLEWIGEVQVIEFPEPGPVRAALAGSDVKVTRETTFRDMLRFIVCVMCEFSRFGTNMRAAKVTYAETFRCSPKTVRRYLRAAEILGVIRVARGGGDGVATAYEINEFWHRRPGPLSVASVGDEPPW